MKYEDAQLQIKSTTDIYCLYLTLLTCFFIMETLIIGHSITKHLGKEFSYDTLSKVLVSCFPGITTERYKIFLHHIFCKKSKKPIKNENSKTSTVTTNN